MTNRRERKAAADVTKIATEIRSEIRRIIRKWYTLKTPLQNFREVDRPKGSPNKQVLFGTSLLGDNPLKLEDVGVRLKCKYGLPDERMDDAFNDFAGSVWHLGDRIRRWDRARGTPAIVVHKTFEKHIKGNSNLLICGDLINEKKHATIGKRSGSYSWLSNTHFDTSNSGEVEFWYKGNVKEAILLVSSANPIPFHIDIYSSDSPNASHDIHYDENAKIGNAIDIISAGFLHWLPLIRDFGIINNDGPEDKAIIQLLMPFCDLRAVSKGSTP